MLSNAGFVGTIYRHVHKGHFRSAGTQILIVAIVLLVAGMVMFNANVAELQRQHVQVQHTNAMLLQLAEVDNGIVGVEFSVRGLALTNRPEYTVYYGFSRRALVKAETALDKLLAGDADDMRLFYALKTQLDRRLTYFDTVSRRGAPAEVAQIIIRPEVRQTRFVAQSIVQKLRLRMLQRLDAQEQAAEKAARRTNRQAVAIIGSAFLLVMLGLFLAQGQSDHRRAG
jgi:CHASE3 domain sensor protein